MMKADLCEWLLFLTFVLVLCPAGAGRERMPSAGPDDRLSRIEALWAAGQWEAVVTLASSPDLSADVDYYRGMALARLERWQEARAAFESGRRKAPHDPRFLFELAGVAYKQNRRNESRHFLKNALRLDPTDAYGNDFLAGIYFLDGNLEAALKFWNREGRPEVRNVMIEPNLRVDPVLLDRAFAIAPRSELRLEELYASRTLVESFGIFHSPRFELSPRDDGTFDLNFRASERNGWGASRLEGLVSLLRDIPHQSLRPEFYNLGGSAWNSLSLLRWDAQKQRFATSISGPIDGNPRLRLQALLDARREHWDVGSALREAADVPADFELRSVEAGAEVRDMVGTHTSLRTAITVSDRRFSGAPTDNSPLGTLFQQGVLLKYDAGLHQGYSAPENRLEVSWDADASFGKVLTTWGKPYARATGVLRWQWLPEPRGKDYRGAGRIGAGMTLGEAPFDELFSLGLETDNDIYLRGHMGTLNGKKGAGPLGRNYLLLNCGVDKLVHRNGLWELTAGPFVDTGKSYAASTPFGSRWLLDAGIVTRFTILGSITLALSYGRNVQGPRDALFLRITGTDDGNR